ncbi:MAG: hypothetical protein EBS90_12540 [Betaproteobacteria bacterium]|nr:hypothetical protein [Betaproteobacteria bacterium]
MNHNLEFWLEADQVDIQPPPAVLGDDPEGMPPADGEENNADETQAEDVPDQEDVSEDPQAPDMPEQNDESPDFEVWKSNFFKESTKGDASKLMEMISPMRDKETLEPYHYGLEVGSKPELFAALAHHRDPEIDKNNPSTSVVNHIFNTLESVPSLNETFIKMMGYSGNKGELHRKFIAALTGSVQVSSSPDKENIIFNEKEYSIKMATRLNSDWGEVALGSWSLREDDPERYLSAPELKRLSEGSPQERDVLRRRIVIESIAKQFEEQSFIIDVVNDEGTIYHLGWDMSNALRGAYTEGKVVVKAVKSENSEAMISDDGQIVPMVDLKIYFVKETGGQDQFGNPEVDEIEFMERRNGMLFLTAGLVTIKEASESMQGTELKEVPYPGNPSDLKALKRCVYSTHDLLMRQC